MEHCLPWPAGDTAAGTAQTFATPNKGHTVPNTHNVPMPALSDAVFPSVSASLNGRCGLQPPTSAGLLLTFLNTESASLPQGTVAAFSALSPNVLNLAHT